MHRENWDDLRFVLAVAQSGSISGAARVLKVNHATVLRRIAMFEARYDIHLFDKTQRGYAVVTDGAALVEAIGAVEKAVLSFERLLKGGKAPLHGDVRITSTDTFCHIVLPEILANIQAEADDLRLELLSTNAHMDMSRLQADITVRPATDLPDELAGRVAAKLGFGLYSAATSDAPGWLGLTGILSHSAPAQWLKANIAASQITGAADSFLTLKEMAAGGAGKVILPCFVGDPDPRLRRVRGRVPEMWVDIWVACHVDMVDVPRIRRVMDRLTAALGDDTARLLGA